MTTQYTRSLLILGSILMAALAPAGCAVAEDESVPEGDESPAAESPAEPEENLGAAELAITSDDLSRILLGSPHPVTYGYQPNGVHAGIDFGSTGNGVKDVRSPVWGTITANTASCGKVAIFDGTNTIILAHMSNRTSLAVGSSVSVGTYLGRASNVVGGGCSATAAHLHMEIRTGNNTSMALPTNNNTNTTLNPLTYGYGPLPSVSLASPASGAFLSGNPPSVTFSWSPVYGATSYRLQVSASNSWTSETCANGCAYNAAADASSTSRTVNLGPGTWYWRVRGGNASMGGYWSAVRSVSK